MRLAVAFAVSLSTAALAVSLFAVLRSPAPTSDDSGNSERDRRIEELSEQNQGLLEQLEATQKELRESTRSIAKELKTQRESATTVSEEMTPDLSEEVEKAVKEALGKQLRSMVVHTVSRGGFAKETEDQRLQAVERNAEIAIDHELPVQERMQALRELRSRDGRSLEVTRAMIELAADPELNKSVRADIFRNLDGVTFPELKPVLVDAVHNDTSEDVRSEAAETLGEFIGQDHPEVEEILRGVVENDTSEDVRREATYQLQGHIRPPPGER